jgi:tRNA threonylcarbamoyl adenosine modification protein YeaZ
MNVLAVETSTDRGSLAWRAGGEIRFRTEFESGRGQAGFFEAIGAVRPLIETCDRIAVGIGPGSYSGMRIGAAAAIGLRQAVGGELVGIPSVVGYGPGRYTVVGDARRGEGYYLRIDGFRIVEGPVLVAMERLEESVAGDAAIASGPVAGLASVERRHPDAAWLAQLAEEGEAIVQWGVIGPLYIREPTITAAKRIPGFRKG